MTEAVQQGMRPERMKLLLEAERRGILPTNHKTALDEARKRGLVPVEANSLEQKQDRLEDIRQRAQVRKNVTERKSADEKEPAKRALSSEFNAARFAMEMGLYCRLADYEQRLGMPRGLMPKPDGKGGIEPEAVMPEEWLLKTVQYNTSPTLSSIVSGRTGSSECLYQFSVLSLSSRSGPGHLRTIPLQTARGRCPHAILS